MAAPSIALAFRGFEVLERTPSLLRGILKGVSKDDLDWQPSPERWSISMVLAHLADVEVRGFVSRFCAIADQENPFLPSYDQLELFKSGKKFDGLAELDKFENLRRDTLAILRSLPPEVGKRAGKHEKLGVLTFEQLLNEFAFHDLGHTRQILSSIARVPSIRTWEFFRATTRSTPDAAGAIDARLWLSYDARWRLLPDLQILRFDSYETRIGSDADGLGSELQHVSSGSRSSLGGSDRGALH